MIQAPPAPSSTSWCRPDPMSKAAQVMELVDETHCHGVGRTARRATARRERTRSPSSRCRSTSRAPCASARSSSAPWRVFGFAALAVLVAALVEGAEHQSPRRSAGSSTPHPGVGRAAKRPNHAGSPSARRYGRSTSTSRRAAATRPRRPSRCAERSRPKRLRAGARRAPAEVLQIR